MRSSTGCPRRLPAVRTASARGRHLAHGKQSTRRTITRKDNSTYEGEVLDNAMHGDGKKEWPSGRSYVGQWKNDMMDGRGTLKWPSGEFYAGHFRKGAFHGTGTRVLNSGETYVGQFNDGEFDGSGTLVNKAEDWTYKGQWMHGRMYGRGRMEWVSGVVYVGEWKDGARDGQGRLSWPDGSCFEGGFCCNSMDGKGCKTFVDGTWFEGEFVSGHLQGQGTFHWPDGREFEGIWHQSGIAGPVEWHQSGNAGLGRLRFLDGTVVESRSFGETGASGQGKKLWTCGCAYMGTLLKNHIHDSGAFTWPDGRRYSGRFHDGAMDGHGMLVWKDGSGVSTYKGEFKQNSFASGSLEWSSGALFEGEFQNGLYHGEGCFEWPGRRSFYRGQWNCGEMCGKGHLECDAADVVAVSGRVGARTSYVYSGAFWRGHMEGKGKLTFLLPAGGYDEYIGDFHLSSFSGLGTFNWNSGASLEGLFEDGYCNRVGRKVYPDGRVYSGELRFDLENGKGVVSEPGGRNFVAMWQNGRAVKELLESYAAELHCAGDLFLDTSTSSTAAITLSSHKNLFPEVVPEKHLITEAQSFGSGYNRQPRRASSRSSMRPTLPIMDATGKPLEGRAAVGFLNGDRYVGCLQGGRKHGHGVYVYVDSMAYRGVWEYDILNGVRHPVMNDALPVEVRQLHTYDKVPELETQSPMSSASVTSPEDPKKETPTQPEVARSSFRRNTPFVDLRKEQLSDDSDSSVGDSKGSSDSSKSSSNSSTDSNHSSFLWLRTVQPHIGQ